MNDMTTHRADSIDEFGKQLSGETASTDTDPQLPDGRLKLIQPDQLEPFPQQDRTIMDPSKLEELEFSMNQRIGEGKTPNVEPLHVAALPSGKYVIHSGHRRHQAMLNMGHKAPLLCLVRDFKHNPLDPSVEMLLTNQTRENLTAIETAEAVQTRVDASIWDHDTAMASLGVDERYYRRMRQLLKAPECVKEISRRGKRQDLYFLTKLATIPEPHLSDLVEKILDDTYKPSDLARVEARLGSQPPDATDDAAPKPKKRKATKASLPAKALRVICDHSNDVRRHVKKACKDVHNHSSLDKLQDGDFVEILLLGLESFLEEIQSEKSSENVNGSNGAIPAS